MPSRFDFRARDPLNNWAIPNLGNVNATGAALRALVSIGPDAAKNKVRDWITKRQHPDFLIWPAESFVPDEWKRLFGSISGENQKETGITAKPAEDAYQNRDVFYFLSMFNASVIGYGGIRRDDTGAWIIDELFVRPKFRGLGVARVIVERLCHTAKEQKATHLFAVLDPAMQVAERLLRNLGFVKTARTTASTKLQIDLNAIALPEFPYALLDRDFSEKRSLECRTDMPTIVTVCFGNCPASTGVWIVDAMRNGRFISNELKKGTFYFRMQNKKDNAGTGTADGASTPFFKVGATRRGGRPHGPELALVTITNPHQRNRSARTMPTSGSAWTIPTSVSRDLAPNNAAANCRSAAVTAASSAHPPQSPLRSEQTHRRRKRLRVQRQTRGWQGSCPHPSACIGFDAPRSISGSPAPARAAWETSTHRSGRRSEIRPHCGSPPSRWRRE